jgi:hypothetical protein
MALVNSAGSEDPVSDAHSKRSLGHESRIAKLEAEIQELHRLVKSLASSPHEAPSDENGQDASTATGHELELAEQGKGAQSNAPHRRKSRLLTVRSATVTPVESNQHGSQNHMRVLRGILIALTVVPFVILGAVAVGFGNAPALVMYYTWIPIACISWMGHFFFTIEIYERSGLAERLHFCTYFFLNGVVTGVYVGLYVGPAVLLTLPLVYWWIYIPVMLKALPRLRRKLRRHQLQHGTLAQFVDDTFLLYFEFFVMIMYGVMNAGSCLASAQPDDPSNLFDVGLWTECGPSVFGSFCLGCLLLTLAFMKVTLIDTGLVDVHSFMVLDVPRSLRMSGVCIIAMASVALYFQASSTMDLEVAQVLGIVYTFFFTANVGPLVLTSLIRSGENRKPRPSPRS